MKAKHQKVICTSFYCNSRLLGLNLMGGCHPLPEIDGWPATRAIRSNKGPAHDLYKIWIKSIMSIPMLPAGLINTAFTQLLSENIDFDNPLVY